MKRAEKEKLLKQRLTNIKNCLEVSRDCLDSAIEGFESMDEFNDLVNNWGKYKDIFEEEKNQD